jgi:hypothetical protein
VFGGQKSYVQLKSTDALFIVGLARAGHPPHTRELHLSQSREAAFGHCLGPYRPRDGIHDQMDAFFGSPDIDGEVPRSGELPPMFFEHRRLHDVRPVNDASFECRPGRFARVTDTHVIHVEFGATKRLGVVERELAIGHESRVLHWDYLVVSDRKAFGTTLRLRESLRINRRDPDLAAAAERLGITLT